MSRPSQRSQCDGTGIDGLSGATVRRTSQPLASSIGRDRTAGFTTSKLIRHRWNDLYEIVLDVESYPAFVPHCRGVQLLSRESESRSRVIIVSRMTVGLALFEVSYASRTVGDTTTRRIDVEAIDGPLRSLQASWKFEPTENETTKVDFSVRYEFDSTMFARLASRVFTSMFGEIVNAFERRADRLLRRERRGTPGVV